MAGRRLIDPTFAEQVGGLAQAAGRADFAELLMGFLGSLVANDMTTMTRYSRFSKPDYLVHSGDYPEAMAGRYLADYYRFDPFYRYWRTTEQPGVVWLGSLASKELSQGRYVREFLAQSGVSDEVGVFLPPLGRASVALFLERKAGRFGAGDRRRLHDLFPVIAGLYKAHVSALFGSADGADLALPVRQPMLVSDAAGRRVFANAAWQALESEHRTALNVALERLSRSSEEQAVLSNGRLLHGEPLDDTFRLAPGGRIWLLEQAAAPPGDTPELTAPPLFEEALTPREQQIVTLVLGGHPTIAIAEKLGLSRGTVKNHRRRIYHKLDITTERELFLLHIEQISQQRSEGGS